MILDTVPFVDIDDTYKVAEELNAQLTDETNSDIAVEFPDTVERYTGEVEVVASNLSRTISECRTGMREQFLTVVDGEVAGMYVVRLVDETPWGIPSNSPNLSGYIARPWRGSGIATFVMKRQLETVNDSFGGIAHTLIRPENIPSLTLARRNGLKETGQIQNGRLVFSYSSH